MVITLDSKLEAALTEIAGKQGISPEELALNALRKRFLPPFEPRDDWERQLLRLATDCGVSLPHSAFDRGHLTTSGLPA